MVMPQCEASARMDLTPELRGSAGCKATREHDVTPGILWSAAPCGVGGTGEVLLRVESERLILIRNRPFCYYSSYSFIACRPLLVGVTPAR